MGIASSQDQALDCRRIQVPPTNGTMEILQREMALLDNLAIGHSGGRVEERRANDRRDGPSRQYDDGRYRRSFDLPPRLESSIYARARHDNEHIDRRRDTSRNYDDVRHDRYSSKKRTYQDLECTRANDEQGRTHLDGASIHSHDRSPSQAIVQVDGGH